MHTDIGDVEPEVTLLALIALGDELAMAALYDRHCAFVYSIARRLLADASTAEDCMYEVFIALWRKPAEFTGHRRGLLGALAIHTWKGAIALRTANKSLFRPPSDLRTALVEREASQDADLVSGFIN